MHTGRITTGTSQVRLQPMIVMEKRAAPLRLTADDQIIIPNDFNFAVLTVSAWFYRSSQADTYQAIVDRSLTNNIGWWIEESQVANEHLFFTGGVASGNYFTTTASLPDFGEWTHVCATYEAGHQELYLNGVLTSTDDNALPLPFPDVNLYIGSWTSTAWFHGAIDDIGIWDRALTTEEIGELYSEPTEDEPSTENLALEFSGISDYLGPNAGILEIPFADALDRTGSDPFTIASMSSLTQTDFPTPCSTPDKMATLKTPSASTSRPQSLNSCGRTPAPITSWNVRYPPQQWASSTQGYGTTSQPLGMGSP